MVERISKRGIVNEGRPSMFNTKEEIQVLIDKYFLECATKKKPRTTTGLALALGFVGRQSLLTYEGNKEFLDTIKRAKSQIEERNEQVLYSRNYSTAGVIFNLTNNHGWKNEMHNVNHERELNDDEMEKLEKFKNMMRPILNGKITKKK